VFVVAHGDSTQPDHLATSLAAQGALPASTVTDDMPLEPGRIYVASSDRHLELRGDRVAARLGPLENGFRPSIDVLFRSAAASRGAASTAAVLLSDRRDDGVLGLRAVRRAGGVTFVERPAEGEGVLLAQEVAPAEEAEHVLPREELVARLVALATAGHPPAPHVGAPANAGLRAAVDWVCPECGGPLTETEEGDDVRFTCRVGHAFSPWALVSRHDVALERALWVAARALGERVSIYARMLHDLDQRGLPTLRREYDTRLAEARDAVSVLEQLLLRSLLRPSGDGPATKRPSDP
jgi:two-component system chemotaxis response regulator CheB